MKIPYLTVTTFMSTRLWGSVNLNVIWKRSDFWQLRDKVTEVVYKVTKVVYKVTEVVYKFSFFYEEQFYITFLIDVALTLFPSLLIESIFLHPYSSDPFYYHPPVYPEFTQTLSFPHFFLQFCKTFGIFHTCYMQHLSHLLPFCHPSSLPYM